MAFAFAAIAAGRAAAQEPSPRELYQGLNAIRVDATRVFFVREMHLRRDAVRLAFSEGKLAFLTAYNGRVTGAVFSGSGRVLAVPREPAERISLARFLGAPLLDQGFSRAYLRFTDDTAAELERQLREAGVEPLAQPSFAEEWDSTVANLNHWHSLRVLADWLAAEPRPYFYAGLLGDDSGPFDVLLDTRYAEQLLLGQPRWVNGVRFYDMWASFSVGDAGPDGSAPLTTNGIGTRQAPALPFVPVSYAIETSILADRSLEGRARLRLKATRGGERMVALELSRALKVESVTDQEGRPLTFFQNEAVNRDEILRRGNDALFVVLGERAAASAEFELRFAYRGSVISDAGNGVYFVGERGSWYPHIGGASHFVPFELSFRWPRRLQLVATGKKLDEREEGEWRVGRWRSEAPIPVAGFNLGDYVRQQVELAGLTLEVYANRQLEDAVLNRFPQQVILPTVPRLPPGPPRPGPPPTPRIVLPDVPPSPAMLMKQIGQDIGEAIHFYEKLHGPFPFERLAISQIPGSFGQGWPGLLYLSTLSFLTPEAQQRAGIGRRTRAQFTELIPFHEVAHQWWGNVVGWSSYRDQWIPEALSNYVALLYADSKKPGEGTLAEWLETYRKELTTKEPGRDETPDQAGPLELGYRLRSSKSPAAYVQVVYGKGSWVFHMLRMMLRDPSTSLGAGPAARDRDARFAQLLQSLLEAHRYGALSTRDLQRALEKLMTPAMDLEGNHSMDWFFDQWVRNSGIPRYAVEFTVRPAPGGGAGPQGNTFVVRGKLKQSGVPETFIAAVPLYAARTGAKPVLLGTVVASGFETSFQFVTRVRPRRILIDPELTLLCLTE